MICTAHYLLKEFKARLSRAPLRAILKYVYSNYESMTDNGGIALAKK